MYTSERYKQIRADVEKVLASKDWTYAPRWRNRVGVPRMAAETALNEALGLVRSINMGTFRNDDEMRHQILDAIDALTGVLQSLARENWRRVEGRGENDGE